MGSKMAGKIYKDKGALQICLIPVLQTLMCRQCLGGVPPVGMLLTQQVLLQPEPISRRRTGGTGLGSLQGHEGNMH